MIGLRGCGKQYASKAAAERSKKGRSGRYFPVTCRCGKWHLHKTLLRQVPSWSAKDKPATSAPDTFSAAVCEQIDRRDGDDTGAVLVRLCQRCGTTRNLHRHHRRLKGEGGTSRAHAHCACNGVTVCLVCHDEIHHGERREMETEGWIVSQSEDEPGSVGVMRFASAEGGATQWPTCSGTWNETAPEMREAVA